MIVALFPNTSKQKTKNVAIGIREFLSARDVTVVADEKDAREIGVQPISSVDIKDIDFALSMGGDGTILRLIHQHPDLDAPILGINLGSLGFMADIPVADIYPSLQDVLNGAYRVQDRIMMLGETVNGERLHAVNEIVIHRSANPHLVELAIHVDGLYLNTFAADGIILSTPSGSTAYSMAAGGPILHPELEAFVLTPISPHTISNRPIVLMPEHEIQVQYLSDLAPVEVSADGTVRSTIKTGEVFHITRAKRTFKLLSLLQHDYYSTLRTKLGWTGKLTR